jgi:hypothetical protein
VFGLRACRFSRELRQALAYCARLDYHGLEINLATVLAAWEGG